MRAGCGLDWDSLDAERRIGFAQEGVQGDPRQVKQDDRSDWASWQRQAAALGWTARRRRCGPDAVQELPNRGGTAGARAPGRAAAAGAGVAAAGGAGRAGCAGGGGARTDRQRHRRGRRTSTR